MNEANRLREIAGHLTQLELLNKNKADAAKDKRRKALRPLFENWGLIANTELAYPLHRGCAELFIMLKNRASEWQELDLGNCTELDLRFGKRQTGGAEHPSFIDELIRWADELEREPAETGRNATPAKKEKDKSKTIGSINIRNFQGILGDVQAENVQTGNHASIHKQPKAEKKNKGRAKKVWQIVLGIVTFLAALLGIFSYLGWLEPIRTFIYNILQLK